MRDDYLNQVICRGNELSLLDRAATCSLPARKSTVRWAVAAGFASVDDFVVMANQVLNRRKS